MRVERQCEKPHVPQVRGRAWAVPNFRGRAARRAKPLLFTGNGPGPGVTSTAPWLAAQTALQLLRAGQGVLPQCGTRGEHRTGTAKCRPPRGAVPLSDLAPSGAKELVRWPWANAGEVEWVPPPAGPASSPTATLTGLCAPGADTAGLSEQVSVPWIVLGKYLT